MKKIEIIFFLEEETIYPFLKEEGENNKEYYHLKAKRKDIEKLLIEDEEKQKLYLEIKAKRYLNFLNNGYKYSELKDILNKALEVLWNKNNYKGIEELYLEKDSLNLANKLQEKKLVRRK